MGIHFLFKSLLVFAALLFIGCENPDTKRVVERVDAFPFLDLLESCGEIEIGFYDEDVDPVILYFKKLENTWVLPDFLSLDASDLLQAMIRDLSSIKISRFVSDKDTVAKRNDLGRKIVRFKFDDGTLGVLEIGKKDKTGRLFVRNGEDKRIYLSNFSEKWSKKPIEWINQKLFAFIENDSIEKFVLLKDSDKLEIVRSGDSFIEVGSENIFGDQINIPKLVAFSRKLPDLEFHKPYPKELWNQGIVEKAKYSFTAILNSGRQLEFSFYPTSEEEGYVLQLTDSDQKSLLYQRMRDGVFVYDAFIDILLKDIYR